MNLEKLFDFQNFENNSRLAKLISQTEARYAKELSDDELDMVNAAGQAEDFSEPTEWTDPQKQK